MLLKVLFLLLGIAAFLWLVVMKIVARIADLIHFAAPCPAKLGPILDNPLRKHYLRKVPQYIGFRPGERVLEIGPGIGVFTKEAASRVGENGQVLAIDIQLDMARQLKARLKASQITNVVVCVANAEALPLVSESVSRAFAVSVMAEIRDKAGALAELRRVLQPGGLLSITEELIDPDYPLACETKGRTMKAGFQAGTYFGGFWAYTFNFTRPADEGQASAEQGNGLPPSIFAPLRRTKSPSR